MERHPAIAELEESRKREREESIGTIKAIQAECPHIKVVHDRENIGGRRICIACGLEELTLYGWPSSTEAGGLYEFMVPEGQRTKLNTEFVKVDDVWKYRVNI